MESQIARLKDQSKKPRIKKSLEQQQVKKAFPWRIAAFVFLGATLLYLLCFGAILQGVWREASLLEDQLAEATEERNVDEGLLQLLFEDSYNRNNIQMTEVTVSAYSSSREQTDSTPHTTASGANTMVGQIAVSRDLINRGVHFGSVVYLENLGMFRVEDIMASRWTNKIDIWTSDKKAAQNFGVKEKITMIWMQP